MKDQIHILNGDSLKNQLAGLIEGEIIVTRECLVDGIIIGETDEQFFKNRAEYFSVDLDVCSKDGYYNKVVEEFKKMQCINAQSSINLWFEHDLFCQCNFWFIIKLLRDSGSNSELYWVQPDADHPYSFGHMSSDQLLYAFANRKTLSLDTLELLSQMWHLLQQNDWDGMFKIAKDLHDMFPLMKSAIEARKGQFAEEGSKSRLDQSILKIIDDLNTKEFGPIFKEFCKREAIYGFGDLQVKGVLDRLLDAHT